MAGGGATAAICGGQRSIGAIYIVQIRRLESYCNPLSRETTTPSTTPHSHDVVAAELQQPLPLPPPLHGAPSQPSVELVHWPGAACYPPTELCLAPCPPPWTRHTEPCYTHHARRQPPLPTTCPRLPTYTAPNARTSSFAARTLRRSEQRARLLRTATEQLLQQMLIHFMLLLQLLLLLIGIGGATVAAAS
jgi:hypothetical protein